MRYHRPTHTLIHQMIHRDALEHLSELADDVTSIDELLGGPRRLAEQMGYRSQGNDVLEDAEDVREFLYAFGRRLERCELMPAGLRLDPRTNRRRLTLMIVLAGHLVHVATDARELEQVQDVRVASYLRSVASRAGAASASTVRSRDAFHLAAARSFCTLAAWLGFTREPVAGAGVMAGSVDAEAKEACGFLLGLLFVIGYRNPYG